MARNVEIKAKVADMPALEAQALALATQPPRWIAQDDQFFPCPQGRLKLRTFEDGSGELIFYRRPDEAGPKTSHYEITHTPEPERLREVLRQAHGSAGRVRKRRLLVMVGRTRVHLDHVEGLGTFMELEVVLAPGEDERAGMAEAHALMAQLGVPLDACVQGAYVDLLGAAQGRPSLRGAGEAGAEAPARRPMPSLTLRPVSVDDLAALRDFEFTHRAWFEARINARPPSYYEPGGLEQAVAQATEQSRLGQAHQILAWVDGQLAGRVNLTAITRAHHQSAELGYRVAPGFEGRGIATQMVAWALQQAFGPLGLRRVQARVRAGHGASLRVLEKNGFVRFGQSRASFELQGQWHDTVWLECHAPDVAAALGVSGEAAPAFSGPATEP